MNADDRGGAGDVLPDIRGVRSGGGELGGGEGDHAPRDIDRVGAGGDGDGLRGRPHLRRPLQPRRYPRLRHLQTLPLETGSLLLPSFLPSFSFFFLPTPTHFP